MVGHPELAHLWNGLTVSSPLKSCVFLDVREHDQEASPHACRGQRRGQRRSGRSRLHHAEWRDREGRLSCGGRTHPAHGESATYWPTLTQLNVLVHVFTHNLLITWMDGIFAKTSCMYSNALTVEVYGTAEMWRLSFCWSTFLSATKLFIYNGAQKPREHFAFF